MLLCSFINLSKMRSKNFYGITRELQTAMCTPIVKFIDYCFKMIRKHNITFYEWDFKDFIQCTLAPLSLFFVFTFLSHYECSQLTYSASRPRYIQRWQFRIILSFIIIWVKPSTFSDSTYYEYVFYNMYKEIPSHIL